MIQKCLLILLVVVSSCSAQNREHGQEVSNEAKGALSAPDSTSKTAVRTGAQVLLNDHLSKLEGKRVGVLMNGTARINGTHMVDTLLSRGINVTAIFAPEHGFRGEAGAGQSVKDGIDAATGLPVYSLYGAVKKPTPEMLEQVDIILFDVQDVGARFYTYNVTLGRLLEAAADAELPVWVLDRPNPAGGKYISGWVMQAEYESFVGAYPIPMAHGLTLGELARMMVGERWLQTVHEPQLKVIPMQGWTRAMKWPETGLEWHPPSPNLPTFEHAYMYLGSVLFEGTNLSEGRGTADPFLTVGAPETQLSDQQISQLQKRFPSVNIKPITFTPESMPGKASNPKLEGEESHGVKISVSDYENVDPVVFGVALLELLLENTRNGQMNDFIYKLAGSKAVDSYHVNWGGEVDQFRNQRQPYLIYD